MPGRYSLPKSLKRSTSNPGRSGMISPYAMPPSSCNAPAYSRRGELLSRLRDLRFLLTQQRRDLVAGHRLADEVALHLVAAREPQGVRLVFRIDALGHDRQPQRARERDDGGDERHRVRLLQHGDDERAVDLERLYRELREVAERGIAGAEVVDGDAHPQLAQGPELLDIGGDFLHENAFGDLQVQAMRRRALADR